MPPPIPPGDGRMTESILDRLAAREGDLPREAQVGAARGVARMKESVKRDLEWLLNCKQALPLADLPAESSELARSLLTYGLPDFTTATLNNPRDQSRIRQAVEDAIRIFEPRLADVRVHIEPPRDTDRSLRFRIEARLRADPAPVPVTFDSVLQLGTLAFQVNET